MPLANSPKICAHSVYEIPQGDLQSLGELENGQASHCRTLWLDALSIEMERGMIRMCLKNLLQTPIRPFTFRQEMKDAIQERV